MIQLLPALKSTVHELIETFDQIPADRISILQQLIDYVFEGRSLNKVVRLNFICTQNSRRSHMSQIWAQTAAAYYGLHNVQCFSGGNEATRFNPNAVDAMKRSGFEIEIVRAGDNPLYEIRYSSEIKGFTVFSKRFDDESNPSKDFAAVMVCSAEDCPYVRNASARIPVKFEDPSEADGTSRQAEVYFERARQIGREMFWVFSRIAR